MPTSSSVPPSAHVDVSAPVDRFVGGSVADPGPAATEPGAAVQALTFEELYREYLPFVWRSARRLGVQEAALEDVAQEVFVVVHRRLEDFEARSSVRTWIYGIVVRVVRDHRRTIRRKRLGASDRTDDEVLLEVPAPHDSPLDVAATNDAIRVLHRLLATLDDDKREVFVLSELEELSAKEIAEVTGVPVNTVYSRLRAARRAFDDALARHRAREVAEVNSPPPAVSTERTFWGGLFSWAARRRAPTSRGRTS